MAHPLCIRIKWQTYLAVAVPLVLALALLGALALYVTFVLGHGTVRGLVPMFHLNAEGNIPTFFSVANLVFCGLLLLFCGRAARESGQPFAIAWNILGLLAMFVAVDEGVQIHELLDRNREWTNNLFKPQGALAGPWVVAYGILVLGVLAGYMRFLLHLPTRYKLLFSFGAALFVGASIGVEMLGAQEWTAAGKSFLFEMINWVEEVCEMSAVTLVNASLLSYIQTSYGPLTIRTG